MMVSTTLTTIAAGKTTSGINNLHSSITNSSASPENFATIETANRSHYQPKLNTSSTSSQHVPLVASPATTTATRNSFCYNRTNSSERTITVNGSEKHNDSCELKHNAKYYQREQQHQQLPNEEQSANDFNNEIAQLDSTATPTRATPVALSLSQALLSPAAPIKDQISLLFPKCRPKPVNNNSSLPSAPIDDNASVARESVSINLNSHLQLPFGAQHNSEVDNHSSEQKQQKQQQQTLNTNNNYCRSVNIITQSPPPPSVSSISSESLSSVTPKISTNPFLGSAPVTAEDVSEAKKRQHHSFSDNRQPVLDKAPEDQLPVPNCAPFYYNTPANSPLSKNFHKHGAHLNELAANSTISKQLQRVPNEDICGRTISEMPRKRPQYERYHHTQPLNGQSNGRDEKPYSHLNHVEILSDVQQYQHQQQMHAQPNGLQSSNQNPFVKDNYWETRQSATPTSTVLNSPDNNRRSMYQQQQPQPQPQQPAQHLQHSIAQQQQQSMCAGRHAAPVAAHHIRSNAHRDGATNNSAITTTNAATQKRNNYNTHQQQQQQQQSLQKSSPYSDGLTPLAAQYLYGSRTSLHDSSLNHPNKCPAKHDINQEHPERFLARERDRDFREQRCKNISSERERYINAALVRESVDEQTANNAILDRRDRERNAYSMQHHQAQQQQQQQPSLQKNSPYSEGFPPLGAQYLYGSSTSLHDSSLNHPNKCPAKHDINQEHPERFLARERDRDFREQRCKNISSERERYINAALVREAVDEQTSNNAILDRRDRERNAYSMQQQQQQQQHHHLPQKYQHQHKPSHYQHQQQKSYQPQQPAHFQRQSNDEPLSSNNDLTLDDLKESWQNLRVTVESSPQVSNTRSLLSNEKPHINESSSTSSAVHHIPKKSCLLNDIKDDKHVPASGSDRDASNSPFEEHLSKYLENNQAMNEETRHGIIEYEGSPRRIGQAGVKNDEDHIRRINQKLSQSVTSATAALVTTTKTNHHNAISMPTTAASSTTANATTNSPKQQHSTARPGFPQRIISPQRESTPTTMQNLNSQILPQEPATTDNNAEDTSNDVSEIGTISDLTTPEAISTANNLLVGNVEANATAIGGGSIKKPLSTPPPPPNKHYIDEIGGERGTVTTSSCTTPTTNDALAAIVVASAANTTATAEATTTPMIISNVSMAPAAFTNSSNPLCIPTKSSTFDYLYEFSETRKVLEEFFKCPSSDDKPIIENNSDVDSIDIQYEFHTGLEHEIEEEVADRDEDIFDDEDDIQLDVENEDDEEECEDDNENENETPQHNQHLQQQILQQQNHHQQHHNATLQSNNHRSQHHMLQQQNHVQQHVNYRNHLQSPTQFLYRPYNENSDGVDDVDVDVDTNLDILDINQHVDDANQHIQQMGDGEVGSIVGIDEHSDHNFSLINNRHNARHHNARRHFSGSPLMRDFDFFLDSASRSSCEQIDQQSDGINHNQLHTISRQNYRYSPETTDYDSNCGDLDSLSGELNGGVSTSCSNYAAKFYATAAMPILEDGLSSGHTSDTENNNQSNLLNQENAAIHHASIGGISMLMNMKRAPTGNSLNSINNATASPADVAVDEKPTTISISNNGGQDAASYARKDESPINGLVENSGRDSVRSKAEIGDSRERELIGQSPRNGISNKKVFKNIDPELDSLYSISVFHRNDMVQMTPPPPAPEPHRKPNVLSAEPDILQPTPYRDVIRTGTNNSNSPTKINSATTLTTTGNSNSGGLQSNTSPKQAQTGKRAGQPQAPPLPERNVQCSPSPVMNSPVWLSRHLDGSASTKGLLELTSENHCKNLSADEEDVDTDLETDRLLGHQRLDDQGFYDENKSWDRKPARSLLSKISPKQVPSTKTRNGYNALLSTTPEIPPPLPPKNTSNKLLDIDGSLSSSEHSDKSPIKSIDIQDCALTLGSPVGSDSSGCQKKDVGNGANPNSGNSSSTASGNGVNSANANTGGNGSSIGSGSGSTTGEKKVKKSKNKEGGAVLIEGVLFRAKYLGSTQLVCEGQPTKSTRMMQAEEAVSRIKAPDGDVQPSTEVDLFISTEKIMVLNTDLKEIMMDHALRTISYIADIGDLVVLMARRRFVPQDIDDAPKPNRTPKMICHVFESDEAQFIAQSIGQAFQVAYMEFLKANGIEDHRFVKEMDYQEVLNSQEIFGDELEIFAKKELQKEVVVPKAKGEILGVVIVESGWGSMLPTVVIANLMSTGAAARCGQLNIGDQLIAINGLSLVGLPLSTCQNYIKNTKNQTVVKFTVVPCPPVVEVKIKRPETKYQLGFSVQNGVICSLLRGGIAERGGVRVGHRIIEINNQSVVAVPHEKIVNLLATSVGEILMKTMPTSMFRLLTGQENPIYI